MRSLRVLRLAPALTSLEFACKALFLDDRALAELVCCLPPTLTHLGLLHAEIPPDLPRPLTKALFSRTPLLQSLRVESRFGPFLRGLLDAGLVALPNLRRVRLYNFNPDDFSYSVDPIPPLLRRFVHRFPEVTVRLDLSGAEWEDPKQVAALQRQYGPRVNLYPADMRPGGPAIWHGSPSSPHASDDEEDSDVEEWTDPHPLTADAELSN